MFSMGNELKAVQNLAPQASGTSAADLTGADQDRSGYEAVSILIDVGTHGDATLSGSDKIALIVEHADDNGSGAAGSYSAVAVTDLVVPNWSQTLLAWATGGIVLTLDVNTKTPSIGVVDYVGGKQYVRTRADATGTTTGTPIATTMLLMKPNFAPVS